MITKLLDEAEFMSTFAAPMRDVLATAANAIDVWPYIAAIPIGDLAGHIIVDGRVEHIYRNGSQTFDQVLVATRTKNVFVVVVVDLSAHAIFGHRLLDLNHEYGLTSQKS